MNKHSTVLDRKDKYRQRPVSDCKPRLDNSFDCNAPRCESVKMNQIREIEKINQQELDRGIAGTSASWHSQFANSAWVYVGNLDHELTEGDVICVMSQYGEIEDIHLVREEDTGKSRGFAFLKYEDARSCVLAVDNLCGVMILGRSLRVDHVENYRLPKKIQEQDQQLKEAEGNPTTVSRDGGAGLAYKGMELENKYSVHQGMDLFAPPSQSLNNDASKSREAEKLEKRKRKEERQRKREEKEERRRQRERKSEKHEERKRRKRSRKHRDDRDGSDRSYNEEETKDRRRSRDEKYSDASVDDGHSNKERRNRKRHRRSRSHNHEKKKKKHRSD